MNNASVFSCYGQFFKSPARSISLNLQFAAKSRKAHNFTIYKNKTRASLAWAYLYHDSNPYIKKPLKELQITPYLRSSKIRWLWGTTSEPPYILVATVLLRTLWLCFHPRLSSSPTYEHMRWPRKVSNKLQTSVKFSKNPSGKTLQNCFIHKSSIASEQWNGQNSSLSIRRFWGKGERWKRKREKASAHLHLTFALFTSLVTPY